MTGRILAPEPGKIQGSGVQVQRPHAFTFSNFDQSIQLSSFIGQQMSNSIHIENDTSSHPSTMDFEENFDFDLSCGTWQDDFLPFLTQYPDCKEELENYSQTQLLHEQEMLQFINMYNNDEFDSEKREVTEEEFKIITSNRQSLLFEQLVKLETKLDDPDVGSIRSFNFWWKNHSFNAQKEPGLYALKLKLGHLEDGFEALCYGTHSERNILLAHYVTKMIRMKQKVTDETESVLGSTKRGYLNSLMRGMKLYEKHKGLKEFYGDWSWADSDAYAQTVKALDKTTMKNEITLSPSKTNKSSAFMEEDQFLAMCSFVWSLAICSTIPFGQRLEHMVRYFVLGLITFGCLRGRDEISECLVKEFVILDSETIDFQMKRPFSLVN